MRVQSNDNTLSTDYLAQKRGIGSIKYVGGKYIRIHI